MKRYAPYILILAILIGLFSPMVMVHAAGGTVTGTANAAADAAAQKAQQSDFQTQIDGGCSGLWNSSLTGCFLKVVYYTIFQLPSFLLWLSAQFFNVMVSLGINSALIASSTFLPTAWAVVRDISNIFFILVLLYIAIETILGLSHGTKQMIARVIVVALLINFSMFFTNIVIDTSNILALVFYNKIDVNAKNADGTSRPYASLTPNMSDKDISGAMYKKFDATQLLSMETLTAMKTSVVNGKTVVANDLPLGLTLGMLVIAGLIMIYAAYTFFIAGISFLGRLVELWVLIIFSPFAFISSTIPLLGHIEYIGWGSWLKRLIATSFMAPIFMFFMYLIFKLLQAFPAISSGQGTISTILSIVIPALIILALLKKATEFAEKGGGEFGQMAIGAGKAILATAGVVGGGLAIGGVAAGLQATVGKRASEYANSAKGKEDATKNTWGALKMGLANYGKDNTFDARKGALKGALVGFENVTGINLGHTSKILSKGEGYETDRKKNIAKRIQRANDLKVGEDEPLTQELRKQELAQQKILDENQHTIDEKDRAISAAEKNRETSNALLRTMDKEGNPEEYRAAQVKAKDDAQKVIELKEERKSIKNGEEVIDSKTGLGTGKYRTDNGNISEAMVEKAETNADKANSEALAAISTSDDATVAKAKAITDGAKAVKEATDAEIKATADKAIATTKAANASSDVNAATAKLVSDPTNLALAAIVNDTKIAEKEAKDKEIAAAKTLTDATVAKAKAITDGAKAVKEATDAEIKATADKAIATTKAANARDKVNAAYAAKTRAVNSVEGIGKSINDYEDEIIPHAKHAIHHESQHRMNAYADSMQNPGRLGTWGIFRGGGPFNYQNMGQAETNEAVYKIRMGAQAEVSGKGGGHGGGDAHGHAPAKPKAAPKASGGGGSAPAGGGHGHP